MAEPKFNVHLDPSEMIQSLIDSHGAETSDAVAKEMTALKAARLRGDLGGTNDEIGQNVQEYITQRFPQLMQGVPNKIPGIISQGYQPEFDEYLASRGVTPPPKTFMQSTGGPILSGIAEGTAATVAGTAGTAVGGPLAGAGAAGLAGAGTRAIVEPIRRYMSGLPQESTGEQLGGAAWAFASDALLNPLLKLPEKILPQARTLFYGRNFTGPTPEEMAQLRVLGEGNQLAGTYGTAQEGFPSPSTYIRGSRNERSQTFGSYLTDLANASVVGS